MIFENILIYYNDKSSFFKRRNVGILEVCDTELKLYHSDYSKIINYNDIASVKLKGGVLFVNIDYVSITLKNGDFYNLRYLYTNIYGKKEAKRKTKLLLRIINDKSKDFIVQERNTSFDQIINKGHKKSAYKRNLGRIEIEDDKIILLHEDFVKEIFYDEIKFIFKKKAIIKIILKNGELFELLDALRLKPNRAPQDIRNVLRMTNIVYNLLIEKWKNKK